MRSFWAVAGAECAALGGLAVLMGVEQADVLARVPPQLAAVAEAYWQPLGTLAVLAAVLGVLGAWWAWRSRDAGWLLAAAALLSLLSPSGFCTFAALFFGIAAALTFRYSAGAIRLAP